MQLGAEGLPGQLGQPLGKLTVGTAPALWLAGVEVSGDQFVPILAGSSPG